jgi:hypothetical protein
VNVPGRQGFKFDLKSWTCSPLSSPWAHGHEAPWPNINTTRSVLAGICISIAIVVYMHSQSVASFTINLLVCSCMSSSYLASYLYTLRNVIMQTRSRHHSRIEAASIFEVNPRLQLDVTISYVHI